MAPSVSCVTAHFLYVVDLVRPLTARDEQTLANLLEVASDPAGEPPDAQCLVVPRTGTISPWSSKATDIATSCGLSDVRRVERGVRFSFAAATSLTNAQLGNLAPLLHDRMTQSVLAGDVSNPEVAAALFAAQQPRPLQHVPLLREGAAALERANTELGLALSADEIRYLADKFG
ncbi:MAG: phosphoribosylformylglycinamidine synthase, partial [Chloroflexota bacterium]